MKEQRELTEYEKDLVDAFTRPEKHIASHDHTVDANKMIPAHGPLVAALRKAVAALRRVNYREDGSGTKEWIDDIAGECEAVLAAAQEGK